MTFTKDTIVAEVMMKAPQTQPLFLNIGMHCLGCAFATGESVEQACMAHGVEVEPFVKEVNEFIAAHA